MYRKFIFYNILSIVLIYFLYLSKQFIMANNQNEYNDAKNLSDKAKLSDVKSDETKLFLICFKHIVDNTPNDADLGKEIRIIFDKLELK